MKVIMIDGKQVLVNEEGTVIDIIGETEVKQPVVSDDISTGVVAMPSAFNFDDEAVAEFPTFSCLPMATDDEKIKAFNALNNPEKKSEDMINSTITMTGFAFEGIMLESDDSGEMEMCPRVVIIDDKGVSCQFVSFGILGALKKVKTTFGIEAIKRGVKIKFRQEKTKRGSMLTFDVVGLVSKTKK